MVYKEFAIKFLPSGIAVQNSSGALFAMSKDRSSIRSTCPMTSSTVQQENFRCRWMRGWKHVQYCTEIVSRMYPGIQDTYEYAKYTNTLISFEGGKTINQLSENVT